MPPSVYRERQDAGPKKFINHRLIPECFSGCADGNGGLVCVLDAETMRTTRTLIARAGVMANRIVVVERNPETIRAMRPPWGVRVRQGDVFAVLDEFSAAQTPIRALVLDGMSSELTEEQTQSVIRASRQCGVSLLFLTLAGRAAARGNTLAARVAALQEGPIGRIFRGLRFAYGYSRSFEGALGMPMMFLAFQRMPCETRYRPRIVRPDPDGRSDMVEVEWYGWPGDTTIEPAANIPTDDGEEENDNVNVNLHLKPWQLPTETPSKRPRFLDIRFPTKGADGKYIIW